VKQQPSLLQSVQPEAMLRNMHTFTALHSHKAVWYRYYCNVDRKTKIKPTRIILKQQTWLKFTLASSNQKQAFGRLPKLKHLLREHTYQGAHLRTKQLRTCCADFPELKQKSVN